MQFLNYNRNDLKAINIQIISGTDIYITLSFFIRKSALLSDVMKIFLARRSLLLIKHIYFKR